MTISNQLQQISGLIGNTPLIEITMKYKGKLVCVYAKLEHYNYTGSIKDRIALHMIKRGYEKGVLKPGDIIAEGTSGNTGIALSALGAFLGHKVTIFMPEWMTKERILLIKSFGADVRLITAEEGGFNAIPRLCADFAKQGGVFLTNQFTNEDNSQAHMLTTGEEIVRQLGALGKTADAFVAGVGTGGTLVGIANRLKKDNPNVGIFPLEPDNSLTMSGGELNEPHFIYGIGDGFIPGIIDGYDYTGVITANQEDSVIMAQMLGRKFGLGVGISSGANLIGAVKALDKVGTNKTVVTVFADDNKKYLTSEYANTYQMKESFISKDIELLDFKVVK